MTLSCCICCPNVLINPHVPINDAVELSGCCGFTVNLTAPNWMGNLIRRFEMMCYLPPIVLLSPFILFSLETFLQDDIQNVPHRLS
jgi:apolipoprotein N-acyltransferase